MTYDSRSEDFWLVSHVIRGSQESWHGEVESTVGVKLYASIVENVMVVDFVVVECVSAARHVHWGNSPHGKLVVSL